MIIKHSGLGVQRRAVRRDGWTKATRATFLRVLAETCNARAAASAVGRSRWSARDLKKRDPEFARLWDEAITEGRERLEEELIACALGQAQSGDNPDAEREEPAARAFDPQLALQVLKMQGSARASRTKGGAPPAQAAIDVALIERLEGLATKLAGK